MKIDVNVYRFRQAFQDAGRGDQFSYAALGAIFDELTELEDQAGEEYTLDVIGLCCEWAEYDSAIEAAQAYGWTGADVPDDQETIDDWALDHEEAALDWIRERTVVAEVEGGGVVMVQF
jgi:hypothetical protein